MVEAANSTQLSAHAKEIEVVVLASETPYARSDFATLPGSGAGDGCRTRDPYLGKVVLYH